MSALERCRIYAFLWVYYGYPLLSTRVNVEEFRYRDGTLMADADGNLAGCGSRAFEIPDLSTRWATRTAGASRRRGRSSSNTLTWSRSFMPQSQADRVVNG